MTLRNSGILAIAITGFLTLLNLALAAFVFRAVPVPNTVAAIFCGALTIVNIRRHQENKRTGLYR